MVNNPSNNGMHADTGILGLRYPEHPGFGEVWRYAKEIRCDGINPGQKYANKS